jgi:hypothetical protein
MSRKNGMLFSGIFALLIALRCVSQLAGAEVLRYTFDEASSGTTAALDSGMASAANGCFVGGATRVPGMGGSVGALDLSANGGLGNWVTAGDAAKLDTMSGITICMWVNLRGNTTNAAILASDGTPFQSGWEFGIHGSTPSVSDFDMTIWRSSAGSGQISTTTIDADHKWVMLAGTFNNSSHLATLYAGSMTASMTNRGASVLPRSTLGANTSEFQIGTRYLPHRRISRFQPGSTMFASMITH